MTSAVVASLATVVAAVLAYLGYRATGRASIRAAEVTSKAVEVSVQAQAYGDALEIWMKTVNGLEKEVGRVQTQLTEMETTLAKTKSDLAACILRLQDADDREESLAVRVTQLEGYITEQGLTVPPKKKGWR